MKKTFFSSIEDDGGRFSAPPGSNRVKEGHILSYKQWFDFDNDNLTLLGPAYLNVSKNVCILGLVWVRVPILFGNDLSGNYLSYSKGFMKFG